MRLGPGPCALHRGQPSTVGESTGLGRTWVLTLFLAGHLSSFFPLLSLTLLM